jgi:two-component system phosphate regulon response regulator PhoB
MTKVPSLHITIVDDSTDNLEVYSGLFEDEFKLELISKPLQVLEFLKKNSTDLIVLDLHMPRIDGFELFRKIKSTHPEVPLVFLTGDSSETSIIKGLELGADDYIVKPLSAAQMIARFKNKIYSRQMLNNSELDVIKLEGFKLHCESQIAEVNNTKIQLTPIEFKFMHLLAKNPNQVFTREYVAELIWPGTVVQNQIFDTHLSNLRRKLKPFSRFIKTIKSRGYILRIG